MIIGGIDIKLGKLVSSAIAIVLVGVVAISAPHAVLAQQARACVTGGAVTDATNTGLASDCETLLEARDTLAGSASLDWAANTPIAQWEGITLRGTPKRVASLNIRGGGLDGSVPAELGRLSNLTYLNLRSNDLSGPIPAELGDLTNLTYLNLHSNQLTGPIPDLSDLTGLEELYLARNKLTGPVPLWLNGMTEMRELWLWGNKLRGTIPDLSGMTSLDKLKLAANDLEGGVPEASALPANLRWLIIQENPLGGTIPDLSGMTSMTVLWLHTNGLTGEVPASHLPSSVTSLNLHTNQLSGTIPDLSGLDKLQWLRLQHNQLIGAIPSTLGDMDSLTRLWLHENMLSGPIPAWFGSLTKLQRLWLSDNMLSGQIPEELGELSSHSLVQWRLAGNDLTGCVPAGLADVQDNDLDRLGLPVCEEEPTVVDPAPVSMAAMAGEAAAVTHGSGAEIEVPAGTTTEAVTVSITEVDPPESYVDVGRVFDFSVSDAAGDDADLQRPVTVRLPYQLSAGKEPSDLVVLHWNENSGRWESVDGGVVDEASQTITVQTLDLSDLTVSEAPSFLEIIERTASEFLRKTLSEHYEEGYKHLLALNVGRATLHANAGVMLILDLDDLLEITTEGKEGYATFWINPTVGLGGASLKYALPTGISFFLHNRREGTVLDDPVYRLQFSGLTLESPIGEFDFVTTDRGTIDWIGSPRFKVCTNCLGVSWIDFTFNAKKGELEREAYADFLDSQFGSQVKDLFERTEDVVSGTSIPEAIADHLIGSIFQLDQAEAALGIARLLVGDDVAPFTNYDDPGPTTIEALDLAGAQHNQFTRVIGGLDINGDGDRDMVFPSKENPDGSAVVDIPLITTMVADLREEKDYFIKVVDLTEGWEIRPKEPVSRPDVSGDPRVDFTAAPGQEADLRWFVGSTTEAADPGVATFQLKHFRRVLGDPTLDEHTVVLRKDRGISDLAVQASRNTDTVVPGGDVIYTAMVSNMGPDRVDDVVLHVKGLDLGREGSFLLITPRADGRRIPCASSVSRSAISCELGGLDPDSTATVTLTFLAVSLLTDGESAASDAEFSVRYPGYDPEYDNNAAVVTTTVRASDEAQDRVFINSAVLNDYRLGLAFPSLRVAPGQEIVGSVDLTVVNDQDDPLVQFPAGATPTWGDHERSFCEIASHVPQGTRRFNVAIDMTAPSKPGTYSLIFAASAETTLAHVMSATDSTSGTPLWNNGDDLAGWDADQALFSMTNGYVNAPYHPSSTPKLFGAGAIRIVVSDTAPVQRLNAPSVDGCAVTDRAVLVALYNATDGDNWNDNTNWLSSTPIGQWYGVTTDSGGRVTSLKLHENNLSGTLPAELGDLTELACLSLWGNDLTGSIPEELGDLTNLTQLDLLGNDLDGSIPSSLGDLTSLRRLHLAENDLNGSIPSSLGDLTNLESLYLFRNNLDGSIPSSLGDLTKLNWLYISENGFTGCVPAGLRNVPNHDLGALNLSYCAQRSTGGSAARDSSIGPRQSADYNADAEDISVSVSPIYAGQRASIRARFQNSSSASGPDGGAATFDLTIYVEPPSGTATRFSWDNEAFTLNQERTFSGFYTFASAGTYTVYAEVYDINGQQSGWSADNRFDQLTETFTVREPVTVQISPSSYTADEDDGSVDITVTLSESLSSAAEVRLSGYFREVKTVTFPANSTSQTTSLTIIDIPGVGPTESSFTLRLSSSDVRLGVNTATATLTVVDDDEATVSFDHLDYRVAEEAGSVVVAFSVVESRARCPVNARFNVHFSYTDPHGVFASAPTSPVEFRECRRSTAITFQLNNDRVVEEPSVATLTLDRVTSDSPGVASRIVFGDATASITVVDRDSASVGFEHSAYSVTEGDSVELCAVLTHGSVAFPFTLNLSYPDELISGPTSFSFGALDTKSCVELQTHDDDVSSGYSFVRVLFWLTRPSDLDSRIVLLLSRALLTVYEDDPPSDSAPSITHFSPSSTSLTRNVGARETFEATAADPNDNLEKFEFFVNGQSRFSGPLSLTGPATRRYTHTFSSPGTHTVRVVFTDSEGASDSVTWTVRVQNTNRAPTVTRSSPTQEDVSIPTGLTQGFIARATDPDSNISRWEWFIDGVSQDRQSLAQTGDITRQFSRRFVTPGSYTVRVTFSDTGGLSDSVSWDVEVKGPDLTTCAAPAGSSQRSCDGQIDSCPTAKQ